MKRMSQYLCACMFIFLLFASFQSKIFAEDVTQPVENEPAQVQQGWKLIDNQIYYYDENGQLVKGLYLIDGHTFFFSLVDGNLTKGWVQLANQTYYFDENGYMVVGWQLIDDNWYFFDTSGLMIKDCWIGSYYLNQNGVWDKKMTPAKWIYNGIGWWYRHSDGSYTVSDFEVISNATYYFNQYGYMMTGWQLIERKWYFFNSSGAMVKNSWIGSYYLDDNGVWNTSIQPAKWELGVNGWWYRHEDGSYTSSDFEKIGEKTYYFNQSGYMVTGWQLINDHWYYFGLDGSQKTGWAWINGQWYFMESDGVMVTGWKDAGQARYYFDNSGTMATGWRLIDGYWYYFQSSGLAKTGWAWINGQWYFMESDGVMVTGWKDAGQARYYFDNSGTMATGWRLIDGYWYYFQSSGLAKTGWALINGQWYFMESDGVMVTGMHKIGEDFYYFQPSGAMKINWINDGDKTYFASSAGNLVSGWHDDGAGSRYYFASTSSDLPAEMLKNTTILLNQEEYVFLSDGRLEVGKVTRNDITYFLDNNGHKKYGWVYSDGYWYYTYPADSSYPGELVINQWLDIGSSTYHFDADGKMSVGWILDNNHWYYAQSSGALAKNGLYQIDSRFGGGSTRWSYFESDGTLRTNSFSIGKVNYTVNGSGYITSTAVNGVPYYNQTDPRWAGVRFGYYTMHQTACVVMISTSIVNFYTNQNYSPVDIGSILHNAGVYNSYYYMGTSGQSWEVLRNHFGLAYENNLSYSQIEMALRKGKLVAAAMNPGIFVHGGTHEILLYGIDANGYVNVYDPYHTERNGVYHLSTIWAQQSTDPGDRMNGGPFFAI